MGKSCTKCNAYKPLSDFPRQSCNRDGYAYHCKVCKQTAHRDWMAKNREANRLSQAEYRAANRDRARARTVAWRKANPGAMANWRKANPDKTRNNDRVMTARRRARMSAVPNVSFSRKQLVERMAYFGNRCWICGGQYDAVDHVKPISKGGANMLSNLRPICTECNSVKCAKWPYPTVWGGIRGAATATAA